MRTVKCFRATFGANPSFAVDKFAFIDTIPAAPQNHLPVKLTIDKSFRENLKSSKTANSSAVSLPTQPPPRPSTPNQDYLKFAKELQMSCMSTPGNKFDDSGWASNGNSVSSFCTDSTLCVTDEADCQLDVKTALHSPSSLDGITLIEPLFTMSTGNPDGELSTLSFDQDASVSSVSIDANDSVESLHEWSMADLPSSWQAVSLELDGSLLPFDHLSDVDVAAADINVVVGNGSHQVVNSRLDYFPEVSELLAYVGEH